MENEKISKTPEKWFGMSIPEGFLVQFAEFKDGSIQIDMETKRDGKDALSTTLRIGPKAFHLLATAFISAAHYPEVWKPWIVEEDTKEEKQ